MAILRASFSVNRYYWYSTGTTGTIVPRFGSRRRVVVCCTPSPHKVCVLRTVALSTIVRAPAQPRL
jgi:hypothetical protein